MPTLTEDKKLRIQRRLASRNRDVTVQKVKERNYEVAYFNHIERSLSNEISPLPDVVNPQRREDSKRSLKLFSEYYFPNKFHLGWSESHIDLINTMENLVLPGKDRPGGGTVAAALPRGSGKSSLAETCAIWALFHGHKKYVLCLAAGNILGRQLFNAIKSEVENNDRLLEDFPEICMPFRAADYNQFRMRNQMHQGKRTNITYGADSFSLPEIEGSPTSGSYIRCGSITASMRGLKRSTASGESLRPDFVIVDDPQTDGSAKSASQTQNRERIIQGAILGLAGPRVPITVVMPCTVIQQGDLADRFLDRERKPEWQGVRSSLLIDFPTNMDMWNKYYEIRQQSFRDGRFGRDATEFYATNQVEMDAGAKVSWVQRFDPPLELSAIQHAMNLYFRDPSAFWSEYQNKPLTQSTGEQKPSIVLQSQDIIRRLSGLSYGICPRDTICITSGVDVQKDILYYITVAWREDFGGTIVDYGSCPEQSTEYYDAQNVQYPLARLFPGLLQSPLTFKGLEYLRDGPLARQYVRDESTDTVGIESVNVDANWNLTADAVYDFCKKNSPRFWPCHGKGIGAAMLPMAEWSKKVGTIHHKANWRISPSTLGRNRGRHILYDTNFWKSRIGERLVTPDGTANGIYLFGKSSVKHQLIADHLSAESPIRTHGRGRDVDEWRTKAHLSENHWWDCLILSAVAASKSGLELLEVMSDSPFNVEAHSDDSTKQYKPAPIVSTGRRVAAEPPVRKR
jgi:hypothetical protein